MSGVYIYIPFRLQHFLMYPYLSICQIPRGALSLSPRQSPSIYTTFRQAAKSPFLRHPLTLLLNYRQIDRNLANELDLHKYQLCTRVWDPDRGILVGSDSPGTLVGSTSGFWTAQNWFLRMVESGSVFLSLAELGYVSGQKKSHWKN